MKGKLNLVTTVKKKKIPNTWQLCLGPSNFGWCSSGLRSTNPSGSNPSTLSLPFSSSKTVEEFEEIFGEWLFWWPLCTFKMSSLVLFFFFLNISLTGKPGRLCRLQNLCFTYEPVHFMVSSTNCRKLRQRRGKSLHYETYVTPAVCVKSVKLENSACNGVFRSLPNISQTSIRRKVKK